MTHAPSVTFGLYWSSLYEHLTWRRSPRVHRG
mgnify:CR=1 FL=1